LEKETARLEYGPQPVDGILKSRGISNADLVGASTRQLTHKVVQKARKGRRLTPNAQAKIAEALSALCPGETFMPRDLFNY